MGVTDHKEAAARQVQSLRAAVLTVSDTRTEASDASGAAIRDLVTRAGHQVVHYRILKDEPLAVRAEVARLAGEEAADFIVTTGGTGISPRDQTIEAVRPLFQKELEGFGDLFRMLSFQEVGSAALLSRATAGTVGRCLVFCLPGSEAAVRLALEKLVLPEIRHLIAQLRKA
ncbi:MAG: MogA/MoaB family molybdenum cofactor biosynthesis protein [Firmicutes bacterium]|nr:MogA/MoaB family molybdenum cofactor biosynthesis protein [Bacillota bacterium]